MDNRFLTAVSAAVGAAKEEAPALPSTGEKSTAVGAAVGAAMVTSALALFGISTYKRKH